MQSIKRLREPLFDETSKRWNVKDSSEPGWAMHCAEITSLVGVGVVAKDPPNELLWRFTSIVECLRIHMPARMLNRRKFSLLAVATIASSRASADLYDDYINSKSKQHFVAFLARKGVPGHAFVATGVKLEAGLVVYERFFGYYPAGDKADGKATTVKMVFSKTSGALEYKWSDTNWDVEYVANIDPDKKAAVLAVIDEWRKNDPKYNLFASGGKNCSAFASEVADTAGLKAPAGAGTTLPIDYIRQLKTANGG